MTLTVNTSYLATALDDAARVAGSSSIQVLNCMRVDPAAGTVTATDTRTTIVANVPFTGEAKPFLLPREAAALVKSLSGNETTITPSDGHITIASGRTRFDLNRTVDSFPETPNPTQAEELEPLDVAHLKRIVRAASNDDARPVLTSVEINGTRLTATDSYRLATVGEANGDARLVPHDALRLAMRFTDESHVPISVGEGFAVFTTPRATVITALGDGQFPDPTQLIPEGYDYRITLDRNEFVACLKRMKALGTGPVRLRIEGRDCGVGLHSESIGAASETLECRTVAYADGVTEFGPVGFNVGFALEGAEMLSGDEIVVELISPLRPALLTSPDNDERYLLMPIRLNDGGAS